MQMNMTNAKQNLKKQEGFTLVEVIAVLVILGILAAVAIPKFFDMQDTARLKALEGAIGELNGQVALAFAQNALAGNTDGAYNGFTGYLGPDFTVEIPDDTLITNLSGAIQPQAGSIVLTSGGDAQLLLWTAGNSSSPGFYALGGPAP